MKNLLKLMSFGHNDMIQVIKLIDDHKNLRHEFK